MRVADRHLGAHGAAERAILLAHECPAREDRLRVLARVVQEGFADHGRVRVRHSDAATVGDYDERRAGRTPDPFCDRVDDLRAPGAFRYLEKHCTFAQIHSARSIAETDKRFCAETHNRLLCKGQFAP